MHAESEKKSIPIHDKVNDLATELETSQTPIATKSADSDKGEEKTSFQELAEECKDSETKEAEKAKPIDQMMKYLADISSEHQSKGDRKHIQ
jgi:hypothetical protein